ncbi:MAG: acetylglutamate kinase [Elusimicrobia bacterium CG1_02_37_114]|nr:MAG: acetylglutamate kinase [Elusimicrobia bacterium CG1_02_37_114]PIV53120.1 MAG: acetylglutamate kinase [Elusimicrobia bacterium CG02_land_8_20_14_3_00_37_13]PIZ14418.1 MAG: acetylglutamate kinase [Elusimicrobia bacterium CG_4_10_14_0_8_um_filter_37_32]
MKIILIKYGGRAIKKSLTRSKILKGISCLQQTDSVIIVHGGGPQITRTLNRLGIKTKFVQGMRYTDKKTLDVVESILCNKVNKDIVKKLRKFYPEVVGISCKEGNIVTARRIKKLGFVGEVKTVNTKYIRYLMAKKIIPVIAPVAYDNKKRTLNINADNVAVALACALKADNLIFMTDVPGVLDKDKKVIPSIKINRIKELIKDKVVTEGMIPKLNSCYKAIKKGVKKVIITNAENGLLKSYGTTIG